MDVRNAARRAIPFGLAAVTALAAFSVLRAWVGDVPTPPIEPRPTVLVMGDRSRLEVCLEDTHSLTPDNEAKAAIQRALHVLQAHPKAGRGGLGVSPPATTLPCDAEPFRLSADYAKRAGDRNHPPLPIVEKPGPFRVMIFVLPDDQIDALFGGALTRTYPQEVWCTFVDLCLVATEGIFAKASDLADSAWIEKTLAQAIGLDPPPVP